MNLKSLSNCLYNRSNLWLGILFTVISFGYLYFIMIPKAACYELPNGGGVSLGTSFGYTYEIVMQFLTERTQAMLGCYQELLTLWDMIFAVTYGLMHVFWISLIYKPIKEKVSYLNLLPIVQVVLDWLENLSLNTLTSSYINNGEISSSIVQLASVFTIIKWIVYAIVIGAILVGIIILIVRSI